jgi:hypothetical protein
MDLQQRLRELGRRAFGNFQATLSLASLVVLDKNNAIQFDADDLPTSLANLTGSLTTSAQRSSVASSLGRQSSRVTTQFDKTNATLANVSGLTANVEAGKTYRFKAVLNLTLNATGAGKVAIAGTATATSIFYYVVSPNENDNNNTINARQTALAGSVALIDDGNHFATIEGTITVNAAGTLTVQFAQASATGTSSVLVGSTFDVQEIS